MHVSCLSFKLHGNACASANKLFYSFTVCQRQCKFLNTLDLMRDFILTKTKWKQKKNTWKCFPKCSLFTVSPYFLHPVFFFQSERFNCIRLHVNVHQQPMNEPKKKPPLGKFQAEKLLIFVLHICSVLCMGFVCEFVCICQRKIWFLGFFCHD